MKEIFRSDLKVYFVDNDVEYVLCVDFGCL